MRAAVLRGGSVETRTVADPVPGPGQLLVRSLACAICASDLHFMDHPEAGADDDSGMSNYDQDVDIVMGHEYCAEVVDYGPRTRRHVTVGTRVSSLPVLTTPEGRRIIGQSPEAPGGFGEYFLVDEAQARVVSSDFPSEVVCVADAMAVGWSMAARAQLSASEVPIVIGCGAIGLSVIAALKLKGIGPIIAADFVASRRQTARLMGADVVVDPARVSPFTEFRALATTPLVSTQAMLSELHRAASTTLSGCVVFECVGVPGVLDSVIKGASRGTRIFSSGGPPEGEVLHTMTAKRKGLNIQFGGGPLPVHWDEAFAAVCSGRLSVTPLLGDLVGLDDVASALDTARDAHGPARIVVVPGAAARSLPATKANMKGHPDE